MGRSFVLLLTLHFVGCERSPSDSVYFADDCHSAGSPTHCFSLAVYGDGSEVAQCKVDVLAEPHTVRMESGALDFHCESDNGEAIFDLHIGQLGQEESGDVWDIDSINNTLRIRATGATARRFQGAANGVVDVSVRHLAGGGGFLVHAWPKRLAELDTYFGIVERVVLDDRLIFSGTFTLPLPNDLPQLCLLEVLTARGPDTELSLCPR